MVFAELPKHAVFHFGTYEIDQYNSFHRCFDRVKRPMKWLKTPTDQAILISSDLQTTMDAPIAEGVNRYERMYGQRMFLLSRLKKQLNSDDDAWAAGRPGWMSAGKGFLSRFDQEERSYLMAQTVVQPCIAGYTRRFGKELKEDLLVTIPSIDELRSFDIPVEFHFSTYVRDCDTQCLTVRSGYLDHPQSAQADRLRYVHPVIRIKDNAPVDVDEFGNYFIRTPLLCFDDDLFKFLGVEGEAA